MQLAHVAMLGACLVPNVSSWLVGESLHLAQLARLWPTPPFVAAVYVVLLVLAGSAFALPAAWYGRFLLERRYRSSRLSVFGWGLGYVVGTLIYAAAGAAVALTVYVAIDLSPHRWWLVSGGLFAGATLLLTHVGPVVVLPTVSRVRPLGRPTLRDRLDALARRMGVPGLGLYEWTPGLGQPHPNAALAGLGGTRRVLLTDSLLMDFTDDEIEVVVAHELAHHLNRDLWITLLSDGVIATLVCGAVHVGMIVVGPWLGIASIGDPVGLPVLGLLAGTAVLLLAPVRNVVLRWQERRADRDAVKMTGNAAALISGVRRLAQQSLAERRPPRLARWLLATHPPFTDRVAAASRHMRVSRGSGD